MGIFSWHFDLIRKAAKTVDPEQALIFISDVRERKYW